MKEGRDYRMFKILLFDALKLNNKCIFGVLLSNETELDLIDKDQLILISRNMRKY